MASIHRRTTIAAPPQAVWDYLADPANWPVWDPDITEVEATEPGIEEHRSWSIRVGRLSATLTFDDVEPPRSFEWDIRALGGLLESEAEFRLEPLDADPDTGRGPGTELHYEFELDGPLGWLIGRVQSRRVVAAVEEGLANIAAAVAD